MSARESALRALLAFERGRGERIAELLDAERLEPRDRAFASELVHGVLRNDRFLDAVLSLFAHRGLPPDARMHSALRLGAYQLLLLGGVPARAAVHTTVELVRHGSGFVNAVLRKVADCVVEGTPDPARPHNEIALLPGRMLRLPRPLLPALDDWVAVRHSLPDFLLARWRAAHGAEAAASAAAAASEVPAITLRPSRGHTPEQLAAALTAGGVECAVDERMVRWTGGSSPFGTAAFRDGWFVVQDPTALRAALAVDAMPGETIVDLCAAPGTKSTLLAERVGEQGRVLAWDIDAARRPRILENALRLGLRDRLHVLDRADQLPVGTADAVLADVPCSNTGVLGRRVEVRHRLGPDSFAQMAKTQRELLQQALRIVRPGGRVVYSTCSIEPDENQDVVRSALRPGIEVVRSELTLPSAGRHDGGFFAVLRIAD
jgi:16S rRNA (cytosine967-C5)-methyltransferase